MAHQEPVKQDEQRLLLTEILKYSKEIPIEALVKCIKAHNGSGNQHFDEVLEFVSHVHFKDSARWKQEFHRLLQSHGKEAGNILRPISNAPQRSTAEPQAGAFPTTPAYRGIEQRQLAPKPNGYGGTPSSSGTPVTGTGRKRGRPSNASKLALAREREMASATPAGSAALGGKRPHDASASPFPDEGRQPAVKRPRGRPRKDASITMGAQQPPPPTKQESTEPEKPAVAFRQTPEAATADPPIHDAQEDTKTGLPSKKASPVADKAAK